MKINPGMFSSTTDQRATPEDFFLKINNEFGFELDVCADNTNHKCEKYFNKEQDGLSQNWDGYICWCNPPYGREIGKRIKKASETRGGVVVMLLPARTDTRRFHDYVYGKSEIRFIKGRLKFGGSKNSAPFPSMLVIFKQN